MEFDELQKIWDTQNQQSLYVINEQALHHRIQAKMRQGYHITNISEWLTIMVNLGAGSLILILFGIKNSGNISMYLLAAWMLATALFAMMNRIRRIKGNRRFDRSLQGDLQYAISLTTYQVHLSQILRWNVLPVGVLTILGLWESGKPWWIAGCVLLFFALTWYASRWEHSFYRNRKHSLETLQSKLSAN
ncbi:hypothetical protein D3H65_07615 [Paraflavitalea soli]|uniref:Uncharacterized protein n=1 Tax=Paraflavitalea soli TaxID=2315862 RepID=A0A3B7MQI1_9BACT|nr:hypothetical protein [Paraflavitalea soli]AXY73855.1 hypothetical protein D3H65_07615 [Paraflavitalea soli]